MSDYKRIACDFYDHFEIYASRQTWVNILLKDGQEFNTRIVTLQTANKEEFAIIESGRKIRLDEIHELCELKDKYHSTWRILDMIEYDLWANNLIIKNLQANQPNDKIISRLSHIINAQEIWLDRINNTSGVYDVWKVQAPHTWTKVLVDLNQQFVRSLEVDHLDKEISYQNLSGTNYTSLLGDILHHVVNHGSYHRGQIMDNIRDLGYETVPTDYIYFVRSKR